ncbi:ATP-dependent helicase HrpB [Qipengyuania flava]|uniref:ATP-dependent helicase HrpB n=1 Tax=Qipengyuania flava TaxID=192812 RepID=UPI00141AE875|nr:ATP-dependent helicase HrpB [Qipengyuania flava]NIJ61266.1 ATP-dependent helicase HrpB [Qipengyuania flava]
MADLPILSVIPELLDALREQGCGVLVAPPGAGKTTAVAPALLEQGWCSGTVILTSPRRVAARAAAERMAQTLGEKPGETVGYVTRLDSKRSARTRVLVVTEAIFVNMILADPELAGVSAVLFDEAHERHLDSDLGLALASESRAVLREDLRVLVMSATIDGSRFAELLGDRAQVIESEGRAYPLEIEWLGSSPQLPVEDAMVEAIVTAWREQKGDILGFLPGVREIERVRERLEKRLPDALLLPLHGQVEPAAQRAAIRRDPDGRRRIVLATAIAETSLTLDGVSVVVDAGLSRRAEFDRAAGTTHLVTHRASQAAAAQRAGRAARQGPGVAYRLWEEGGHGGRPPYDPPEMVTADLAPLVLSLAQWGTADPDSLAWLDPPPAASVDAARSTLSALGALDEAGRITERGTKLAQLPLDPQGAATILFGAERGDAERAAKIALLLQERSLGGRGEDLDVRLTRWNGERGRKAEASRKLASRWARRAQDLVDVKSAGQAPPPGIHLAAGRPEFIAKRRDARGEQWIAAGGRGFVLDPTSTLARADFIVVGDAQGQAKGARITAGIAVGEGELERWFPERIERRKLLRWTGERVEARVERRLGTIVLAQGPDPEPDSDAIVDMLVDKVLENPARLVPQDLLARAAYAGLVQFSPSSLQESASVWLRPLLEGRRDLKLSGGKLADALLGVLDWESRKKLDRVAPREFISPAGTSHRIDYASEDAPSVEVRVQALFGLERHPVIGEVPLLLKLTSPAGRSIQATRDLPGFWRGSWADVRKEMKGRYPKHRWPEEPWAEAPSLKTKNAFSKSGG